MMSFLKKHVVGIITILVVIVFAISLIFYFSSDGPTVNDNKPPRLDKIDPANLPQTPTVIIPANGREIEVKNFLPQAVEITSERVGLVFSPTKGIVYSPAERTFYMTISAEDVAEFNNERGAAERLLLSMLGISESEACLLNVIIRTPASYNEVINDKTFPLSFCQTN